jgi:site-specific DNA-adenine methylase
MLGVTPESIDTLFEPIVKFAKGGNNTLTVDAVAAIKHDILNLYENIKERTKLATNAILLPLRN